MVADNVPVNDTQYSLLKILAIWCMAALPMAILAWVITPLIIPHVNVHPGIVYWLMMILGMIWQFLVSLVIVKKECGNVKWSTIKKRMWYNQPRNPKTMAPANKLFFWVIPFILFIF